MRISHRIESVRGCAAGLAAAAIYVGAWVLISWWPAHCVNAWS